jgi:hypothetical protein
MNIFNEDRTMIKLLLNLTTPKDFSDFLKYAMRYRETHPVNNDGWRIYKMKEEYKRQGVNYAVDNFVNEIGKKEENVY